MWYFWFSLKKVCKILYHITQCMYSFWLLNVLSILKRHIPFFRIYMKAWVTRISGRMCYEIQKTYVHLVWLVIMQPRTHEKKLIDIIEFQCNKLQSSKIYGNLARNFKVNGILSINFSSFQIFFNSKVYIGKVKNLKIIVPIVEENFRQIFFLKT